MAADPFTRGGIRVNKWAALAVVGLGTFLSVLDSSAVNVSLPAIATDLGADTTTIQWVVMGYLLTITGLLLTFGRLGDVAGRKLVYVAGMAVFTVAVALCGAVSNIEQLVALRVIQGIGSAGVMAISPAITASAFPRSERGKALGINATLVALGAIAGPILGGLLTQMIDWRWVFVVRAPFGLLAVILAIRVLRDEDNSTLKSSVARLDLPEALLSRPKARSFDLPGGTLLFAAISALTLGLNQGRTIGWTSPTIAGLLIAAVILMLVFVIVESRVSDPMLDLSIFRNRAFAAASASSLLSFMASFSVTFLMPFYLVQMLDYPPAMAGLALIPQPLAMSIVAPLSGSLSDRIGARLLSSIGMCVTTAALFWLSTLSLDSGSTDITLRLGLLGIGLGLFNSPNSSALISSVPVEHMGIASGMMATMRNLGMVLGTAVAGAVWTGRAAIYTSEQMMSGGCESQTSAVAQVGGFQDALMVSGAIAAIGVMTSLIRGRHEARQPS